MVTTSADPIHTAPSARTELTRAAVVLAEFHAQRLDIAGVLTTLETSILVTPVADHRHLLIGHGRGVTWIPTFTSEDQLRRYAIQRCEAGRPWRYLGIRGAHLLGPILNELPRPCGLAIDIAGAYPLLLPRRPHPSARGIDGRSVR